VRAEREDGERFRIVLAEALRRIEGISDTEHVRWHELLHFLVSWAVRRRPGEERPEWQQAAVNSQRSRRHRQEVERMAQVAWRSYEEEMEEKVAQAAAQATAQAVAHAAAAAVRARRQDVMALIRRRFGSVPDSIQQKIERCDDPAALQSALVQVYEVSSPEDLPL
jgi:hypothetical protein